jgi:predicted neuraminidase
MKVQKELFYDLFYNKLNIMRIFGTLPCLFFLPAVLTGQIALHKVSDELIFKEPPFAQCHASTIVEVAPDKFMAAAFGGTSEGKKDVCIWLSATGNGKWSIPVKMADGIINDTLSYPCWNPVLFKTKEGKLFLFYKVGPSPRKWWGMVRTSLNDGKSWTSPERLPAGILGPIKNKPVQLPDGTIISPSSVETTESWKIHIEKSADFGKTWQFIPVDPESELNVIQPSILIHSNNSLQIMCRSKSNAIVQCFSDDNGNNWGALSKTVLPNPNSGIDAVTLKNGWYLLVYNPTIQGHDDRAKLNVAISKDGIKWTDAFILENEEKGEFSYPAVIQANDGKVHITYTYNRLNIKHVVLEVSKP